VDASYLANVNGTCRRCAADTSLFSRPLDREQPNPRLRQRKLQSRMRRNLIQSSIQQQRSLQSSGDVCFCRADGLDQADAPDPDAFFEEYSDNVESLDLPSVVGVASASEVPPISACEEELITVIRTIEVQWVGGVPQLDIESISNKAKGTYNAQRQDVCELQMLDVTLLDRRRLQVDSSTTFLQISFLCPVQYPELCDPIESIVEESVTNAITETGVTVIEIVVPTEPTTPAPSQSARLLAIEEDEEDFFDSFIIMDPQCKCVACDQFSGCEDLWQGRVVTCNRMDPNPSNRPRTHVVVSHCSNELQWLHSFLHSVEVVDLVIISRCGKDAVNAPSNAIIVTYEMDMASTNDVFLSWITHKYDHMADAESVIFVTDDYDSSYSGPELASASKSIGFRCAVSPPPSMSPVSMSVFYKVDVLQQGDISSFWTETGVQFEHEIIQVCESETFAVGTEAILRFDKQFWEKLSERSQGGGGDNMMKYTWAGLLNQWTPDEVGQIISHSNLVLENGLLVHTHVQESPVTEVTSKDATTNKAKMWNFWERASTIRKQRVNRVK